MIKGIYFIQNGLAITNKLNNKFPCIKRRRHTGLLAFSGDSPRRACADGTLVIVLNHPKNKLNREFYHVSLKLIQS